MKIVNVFDFKGSWGYVNNLKLDILHTGYVWYNMSKDPNYRINKGKNVILEGELTIGPLYRGRSAAGVTLIDEYSVSYYVSIANIVKVMEAIANGQLQAANGKIFGRWTFVKQGSTISLTPYVD